MHLKKGNQKWNKKIFLRDKEAGWNYFYTFYDTNEKTDRKFFSSRVVPFMMTESYKKYVGCIFYTCGECVSNK